MASLGFVTAMAAVAVLAVVLRDWWFSVVFVTGSSIGVLAWDVGVKAKSSQVRVMAAAVGSGAVSILIVCALLLMPMSWVMILAVAVQLMI